MDFKLFAFAVLCVAAANLDQASAAASIFNPRQGDDSCVGRCEQGLDPDAQCQCNGSCGSFGDCCSDYNDVCLSCKDRCGIDYQPNNECQCNVDCNSHSNCCADFNDECDGGEFTTNSPPTGSPGEVTDAELKAFSESLLALDTSGIVSMYTIDPQGSTCECCGTDEAPNPLFTTFDEAIWDIPTVSLFRDLFDNYHSAVTTPEEENPIYEAEEEAFIDAVMATPIMNAAYEFVNSKGVFTGTFEDYRAKLSEIWFERYDRDGTSATVLGSSGFEHVFIGEIKSGKVSGFHNWLHWYSEESAGEIEYLGLLASTNFAGAGDGISNVYDWEGKNKCYGSFFVGTLPEMDLAVFSTCFLARMEKSCPMQYNGVPFYITTFNLDQNGKQHVGSAYPDW